MQWLPQPGHERISRRLRVYRGIAMCRDEDRWNGYVVAYEMLLKLHSVHVRHLKVDDQAFGETVWQRREKFLT